MWLNKYQTYSNHKSAFSSVMELIDLITNDPGILGGQPTFKDTRVPIEALFYHWRLALFIGLKDFPTVTKEHAIVILEVANKLLTSKNVAKVYGIAA